MRHGGGARLSLIARIGAIGCCCVLLTQCGQTSNGRFDPKYGVSSSPRLVALGEPVPKGGGVYRVGKPYTIAGQTYEPQDNSRYTAEGFASWYGEDFHGRATANGEIYDMASITAAHPTLPIPSYARVTNLNNHKSIIVRVNDRGPYHANRLIDVSVRTAKLLGFYDHGVTRVRVSLDEAYRLDVVASLASGWTTSAAPRSKAPTTPSLPPRCGPAHRRPARRRSGSPRRGCSCRTRRSCAALFRCRPTARSTSAMTDRARSRSRSA